MLSARRSIISLRYVNPYYFVMNLNSRLPVRVLLKVRQKYVLFLVTEVMFPRYTSTTVSLRPSFRPENDLERFEAISRRTVD